MSTNRRSARLGAAALAGALSLLLPAPGAAQFIPYFGKNKVKYDNFS